MGTIETTYRTGVSSTGRTVALTLAGGILAGAGVAMALANALEPADAVTIRACQTEDSVNCYWRADTMGNGEGRSFVDLNGHFYVEQTPYADR